MASVMVHEDVDMQEVPAENDKPTASAAVDQQPVVAEYQAVWKAADNDKRTLLQEAWDRFVTESEDRTFLTFARWSKSRLLARDWEELIMPALPVAHVGLPPLSKAELPLKAMKAASHSGCGISIGPVCEGGVVEESGPLRNALEAVERVAQQFLPQVAPIMEATESDRWRKLKAVFDDVTIENLRQEMRELVGLQIKNDRGLPPGVRQANINQSPYELDLMAKLADLANLGDPDLESLLTDGVPIGVGEGMMPSSGLFEQKPTKDSPEAPRRWPACGNYSSVNQHGTVDMAKRVLMQADQGWLTKGMSQTEAEKRFGSRLAVAPLGVRPKVDDFGCFTGVRPIWDGTKAGVNCEIHIPEKMRLPGISMLHHVYEGRAPGPAKRWDDGVSEMESRLGALGYDDLAAVKVDIESAYRTIEVMENDRGLLGIALPTAAVARARAQLDAGDDRLLGWHGDDMPADDLADPAWLDLGAIEDDTSQWTYFFEERLPFGLKSAPWYFQRVAARAWSVGRLVQRVKSVGGIFVDDGCDITSKADLMALMVRKLVIWLVCGVPIKWSKVEWTNAANCKLVWLGYEVDLTSGRVTVPPTKLAGVKHFLMLALNADHVTGAQLAQLLGKLGHVSYCHPQSKPFLQSAWALKHRCKKPSHRVRMTARVRDDLRAWLKCVENTPPASFPWAAEATVQGWCVDASGSHMGGWLVPNDNQDVIDPQAVPWFSTPFPQQFLQRLVAMAEVDKPDDAEEMCKRSGEPFDVRATLRELIAILIGCKLWGKRCSKNHSGPVRVRVYTDNLASVYLTRSMSTRIPAVAWVLRELSVTTAEAGIILDVVHVRGKTNIWSDAMSRPEEHAEIVALFDEYKQASVKVTGPRFWTVMPDSFWA